MGHCVISALVQVRKELGAFRHTILADGDNCLLFVESRVAQQVNSLFEAAVSQVSGQEIAVEKPVTSYEQVTFGQCKPCFNGEGYVMVRDPLKVVSQAFSGYRHYNHYTFGLSLAKSISIAELHLSRGVPILEAYFAKALVQLRNVRALSNPEDFLDGHLIGVSAREHEVEARGVTAEARQSFAVAWGIGVEEQLAIEAELVRGLDSFPNSSYLDDVVEVADCSVEPFDHPLVRADVYLSSL